MLAKIKTRVILKRKLYMKKFITAIIMSLAFTGNALACGEKHAVQASKKPEIKVASKAEVKDLNELKIKKLDKSEGEASNTPEAKAE